MRALVIIIAILVLGLFASIGGHQSKPAQYDRSTYRGLYDSCVQRGADRFGGGTDAYYAYADECYREVTNPR